MNGRGANTPRRVRPGEEERDVSAPDDPPLALLFGCLHPQFERMAAWATLLTAGTLLTGIRRADPHAGPSRKRRTPPQPPLLWPPYEAAQVLDEVGGELGLLLFQRVRDVLLWSGIYSADRQKLFGPKGVSLPQVIRKGTGAFSGQEIKAELATLEEMVSDPESADAEQIANACAGIYHWARDRVLYATAALFARAAAVARPNDPMFSIYAARGERAQAAYERSKLWFQVAISVARRSGKRSAYTVALLGWANLEIDRGNRHKARALLVRAWRYARRHSLRHLGAEARHDLLALAIDLEDYADAEIHARAAFQLYGPRSRNLFALAHDWALIWIKKGYYSAAVPIMEAVLPYLTGPSARILALSSIALAAGALGNRTAYQAAAESVLKLAGIATENTPIALVHLAEGAHGLGDLETARELAARARELARGRQDVTAESCASQILSNLRTGSPPMRNRPPPPEESVEQYVELLMERVRHAARLL